MEKNKPGIYSINKKDNLSLGALIQEASSDSTSKLFHLLEDKHMITWVIRYTEYTHCF